MKTLILTLAAIAAAAALSACKRPEAPQEPPRAVKLLRVAPAALQSGPEYAAEIRARIESALGFRVGGKLLQRQAQLGQTVKAGQLLALLDAQDYRLGARAANAQVASALTQREQAQADLRRSQSLKAQGFVSDAEVELRQTALRAAEAALDAARAQAGVQGNQASYARLLADADGVVVSVDAEPGQVVAPGQPVLRLAHAGARDAWLALPEDQVGRIQPGLPAQVRLWGQGSARTLPARVREVAASADPLTRTYLVKVAIEGREQPALGATASVRLGAADAQGAPSAAIRLPTTALWQQGKGSAVWVYDDASRSVKARAVEVAGLDGNEAVIAAGLQPGEEVVATGVHVLSEGQAVRRYQPRSAEPAQAGTQGASR
ncbi:MAG: hypothetical protein RJA36_3190 [Pseudomonadota bacterium]|jgi:RND family efflux transporter MFP subunit